MAVSDYTGDCNRVIQEIPLTFRRLHRKEIQQVHEMTSYNKWSLFYEDILDSFDSQPHAFYGAFLQSKPDMLISTCSLTSFDKISSDFNFFLTHQSYRQKGIGKQLFQWVTEQSMTTNITLNCEPTFITMYERWNFKFHISKTKKYHAVVDQDKIIECKQYMNDAITVSRLTDDKIAQLLMLDAQVHGYDRSDFLRKWLSSSLSTAYVAFLDEKCVGYIIIRHKVGSSFCRLAPFIAISTEAAYMLLKTAVEDSSEIMKGICIIYILESDQVLENKRLCVYSSIFNTLEEMPTFENLGMDNFVDPSNTEMVYSLCSGSICPLC